MVPTILGNLHILQGRATRLHGGVGPDIAKGLTDAPLSCYLCYLCHYPDPQKDLEIKSPRTKGGII